MSKMENPTHLKSLQEYFCSHPFYYIPWCQRSAPLPPPLLFVFFFFCKMYLLTAGYADFHRYKWLEYRQGGITCRMNLQHIQPSKQPALFHALGISQSLKLCYQPFSSLWIFLILSIVYAEIFPKIHISELYSSIILID